MMNLILKHIESIPSASFTERELSAISRPAYERLKKLKCLTMVKYDYLKEPYFGAGNGDEYFVKKDHGCYYAYSVESLDALPVKLDENDLRRFQLSFQALFEIIRAANKIEGVFQEINEGNFYVGYKLYDKFRVGFIFIPKISKDKLVKFAGLKDICKDDNILVIITPFTKIEDIVLKWTLSKCKIVTVPLASVLDMDTFKLPIDEIIKEFSCEMGKTTELTKKQTKDYKSYGYKCYDKIHIPGTTPMRRSNNLVINGHTIKMPDEAFKLLIELVVVLKKGKGGWMTKVVDAGKYQIFDRVRTPLQGSLLDKDGKKFIENDGSKQYRISTHPDFVTYDRANLLKHTDPAVKALAKSLKK